MYPRYVRNARRCNEVCRENAAVHLLTNFIWRASPQEGRRRWQIDPRGDAGAGEKRGDEAIAYAMGIIAEGQDEARKAKMRLPGGSRTDVELESNAST